LTQPSCYAVIKKDTAFIEMHANWYIGLTSRKRQEKKGKKERKSGKANKEKTETFSDSMKCRVKSHLYRRRPGRQGLDLLVKPTPAAGQSSGKTQLSYQTRQRYQAIQ